MRRSSLPVQRYLVTGVLTVIPLWLTWIVFDFVLRLLSRFGAPWVQALAAASERYLPTLSALLGRDWIQNLLAALFTLAALVGLGWLATHVLGRRLIQGFERLIGRIPIIQSVYGGTKKVLEALQTRPEGTQRVVLIEFPTPEMKPSVSSPACSRTPRPARRSPRSMCPRPPTPLPATSSSCRPSAWCRPTGAWIRR